MCTGRISSTALVAIAALALPPAAAGRSVTVRPGSYRATPRFTVAYSGSGHWATSYEAEPSDGGGKHDTDTADDSSTQSWMVRFAAPLVVPKCAAVRGRPSRCRVASLTGAEGRTSATGRIDHLHLDGLYPQLNASLRCRVRAATPSQASLEPEIEVSYSARSRSVSFTALNPVSEILTLLPPECPGQGDSLDGLDDNYFTPGFSFAPGWGPARWFTSAVVSIPVSVLRRASRITIPLADTRRDRPPRDCAAPHPSWQRCRTGGAWSGRLILTARR